jgi:hypothetical protein
MNRYYTGSRKGKEYPICNKKRRKANWIGHCLLKHIIEGRIAVTGRRGRRRKQLLNLRKREDTGN